MGSAANINVMPGSSHHADRYNWHPRHREKQGQIILGEGDRFLHSMVAAVYRSPLMTLKEVFA
jgi:hypothetical protein